MKKSLLLALVATVMVLMAGAAQAAELTARGYWWIEGVNRTNWNFNDGYDNHFSIEEKLRTAFYFTANENLRAVLDTQIGTNNWGNGLYMVSSGRSPVAAATGANGAGNGNIMLRQGFIEYKWPGTLINTKVGFQVLSLPSAFGGGSPIFDDIAAAAVVSAPINENVSVMAGYTRLTDGNGYGTTAALQGGTATDAVLASVPLKLQNVNLTPFAMYAYSGRQSFAANRNLSATPLLGMIGPNSSISEGARGYWGGAALTWTAPFDMPLKVMADFNYGSVTYTNYFNGTKGGGRAGWLADFAVDYTGLSWGTPEFFFVYSSGETGRNTDRSNRMPVIGIPQNYTVGSFFFGERLELAGSMNVPAGYTLFTLGYFAPGITIKNMSFFDKLFHDFTILYARGTNSVDYLKNTGTLYGVTYAGFLTTKDSLWEVDLNTRYKIYDELTAYLYLGYIHSNFNMDVWKAAAASGKLVAYPNSNSASGIGSTKSSGDAWKIGVGLNYFF